MRINKELWRKGKMKKVLIGILALIMVLGLVGCSGSSKGYEGLIDNALQALQSGDVDKLTSLLDMENIENGLEALTSVGDITSSLELQEAKENYLEQVKEQEDFLKLYDDLEYQFDKDFTVEKGNLYIDDDSELSELDKIQRLRKLEKKSESIAQTEFMNTFVDSLSDIKIVRTAVTLRSKDGETKNKIDLKFTMYQRNGKWYLDSVNYSEIKTPGLLSVVYNMLAERDNGSISTDDNLFSNQAPATPATDD